MEVAYTVQEMPSQVEIDMQPEVGVSPWLTLVLIPLTIAAMKIWEKWVPSKTDHVETVTAVYRDQITTLVTQVKTLAEQQSTTQARLDHMEKIATRETRRGDIAERVALRLAAMVEEHRDYLELRIAARNLHDPEGDLTPWVPDPPAHLLDQQQAQKYREMLESLNDDDDEK